MKLAGQGQASRLFATERPLGVFSLHFGFIAPI